MFVIYIMNLNFDLNSGTNLINVMIFGKLNVGYRFDLDIISIRCGTYGD